MAKKKNLVGGAKVKISLMLTAGMIAGWGNLWIRSDSAEWSQKTERNGGEC